MYVEFLLVSNESNRLWFIEENWNLRVYIGGDKYTNILNIWGIVFLG